MILYWVLCSPRWLLADCLFICRCAITSSFQPTNEKKYTFSIEASQKRMHNEHTLLNTQTHTYQIIKWVYCIDFSSASEQEPQAIQVNQIVFARISTNNKLLLFNLIDIIIMVINMRATLNNHNNIIQYCKLYYYWYSMNVWIVIFVISIYL